MKNFVLCFLVCVMSPLADAKPEINKSIFGGVAIKGYDPVAYFTEKQPVKGQKSHTYMWKNANWRFASEANLKLFKDAPEKYAPQYGGYCAYAVSQGTTAGIDPDQWTVLAGKLYLNVNRKINEKWSAKRDAYIKMADKNWPDVIQ